MENGASRASKKSPRARRVEIETMKTCVWFLFIVRHVAARARARLASFAPLRRDRSGDRFTP